jgi:hypothetical protein
MQDHSESIQLEYDPDLISYKELVNIFWNQVDPAQGRSKPQYASCIFYHDEEQKKIALAKAEEWEKSSRGRKCKVRIEPVTSFFYAEDYHQKFELRQKQHLFVAFSEMKDRQFIDSPAAAKFNAFASNPYSKSLTADKLADLVDQFDLDAEMKKSLKEVASEAGKLSTRYL